MNQPEASLENLLRLIVEVICRNTKEPVIRYIPELGEFTVKVHPRDQGRMIGKGGGTIGAINAIFWYAGAVSPLRRTIGINLQDVDKNGEDCRPVPFVPDKNWDRRKIGRMIDAIVEACITERCGAWVIEEREEFSLVIIRITKYLEQGYQSPSLPSALGIVIRAAGMAQGVNLQTEIEWR